MASASCSSRKGQSWRGGNEQSKGCKKERVKFWSGGAVWWLGVFRGGVFGTSKGEKRGLRVAQSKIRASCNQQRSGRCAREGGPLMEPLDQQPHGASAGKTNGQQQRPSAPGAQKSCNHAKRDMAARRCTARHPLALEASALKISTRSPCRRVSETPRPVPARGKGRGSLRAHTYLTQMQASSGCDRLSTEQSTAHATAAPAICCDVRCAHMLRLLLLGESAIIAAAHGCRMLSRPAVLLHSLITTRHSSP